MPSSKNTQLISQGLDCRENDERRVLGYLQRLNLAGYDVKGQLSSAYGQSGVGLSVSAKVDFGAILLPFTHVDVGASLESEGTAHTVILLHRMPHRIWLDDMVRPPQPPKSNPSAPPPPFPIPFWSAKKPLVFAQMKGKTWRLKASLLADAWAGIGSNGNFDETGLTVGAAFDGELGGTLTRLVDTAPRHYYPTPSDSNLSNDVDDLFEQSIKAKAAAWLVESGGGVIELKDLGVPRTSLVEQAKRNSLGSKIEMGVLEALDAYDKLAIPDVDSSTLADAGFSVIKSMAKAAKKVKKSVVSKKLDSKDLLNELRSVRKQLDSWIEYLSKESTTLIYSHKTRRSLREVARLRRGEANDLIGVLERRQVRKRLNKSKPTSKPAPENSSPRFHLDFTEFEGEIKVKAGGKVSLSKAKAHAEVGAAAKARRIWYRYQSYVGDSASERRLTCSQQTAIEYCSRKMYLDAAAGSRNTIKEKPNLVTLSYRSVLVNWFDDLLPNNQQALPNGSGVSFGMSVLAESFATYVRACKKVKDASAGGSKAKIEGNVLELEKAMCKQLRVSEEELRAFMRNAPSSMGSVPLEFDEAAKVESYIVESAFAITRPIDLKSEITDRRPKDLFNLDAVKDLVNRPSQARPDSFRLQVIRLRFRIRSDDDKSYNLIKLGWNPEPWGDNEIKPWGAGGGDKSKPWYVRLTGVDPKLPNWLKKSALALQIGIGIERVRRVGSEGIVDIFQWHYPHPYSHQDPPKGYGRARAKELEIQQHRNNADMLVPPVTLFSK